MIFPGLISEAMIYNNFKGNLDLFKLHQQGNVNPNWKDKQLKAHK